ncbi:polysaccharide deacetylase family protein [Streptomyces sp. NPDC004014]
MGDHTVTHPHSQLCLRPGFFPSSTARRGTSPRSPVTGHRPRLLRPPFGAYDARVRAVAGRAGPAVVTWSLDPRDWKRITPQVIEQRVIDRVCPGRHRRPA